MDLALTTHINVKHKRLSAVRVILISTILCFITTSAYANSSMEPKDAARCAGMYDFFVTLYPEDDAGRPQVAARQKQWRDYAKTLGVINEASLENYASIAREDAQNVMMTQGPKGLERKYASCSEIPKSEAPAQLAIPNPFGYKIASIENNYVGAVTCAGMHSFDFKEKIRPGASYYQQFRDYAKRTRPEVEDVEMEKHIAFHNDKWLEITLMNKVMEGAKTIQFCERGRKNM